MFLSMSGFSSMASQPGGADEPSVQAQIQEDAGGDMDEETAQSTDTVDESASEPEEISETETVAESVMDETVQSDAETSVEAEIVAMEGEGDIGDIPPGEDPVGKVTVNIEDTIPLRDDLQGNDGRPFADPGPMGSIVEGEVDLYPSDSMMSVIARICKDNGIEIVGAEQGYIKSINGRGEFDRGSQSGWMGTLNDWFTNEGFAKYTVASGKLKAGDVISVMYTTDLGEDLGNSWGNNNKTLASLEVGEGDLYPVFTPSEHEYTVVLPNGADSITVTPTAANKKYQIRIKTGGVEYRVGSSIPVSNGSKISITCGEPSWLEGEPDQAEAYTLTVINSQDILQSDSVKAEIYNENGDSMGEIALAFDSGTYTYSGSLPAYTHLQEYNASDFDLTFSGLPENVQIQLKSRDGGQSYTMSDGKIQTNQTKPVAGKGPYTYYIVLTDGGETEYYPLELTKPKTTELEKCNFTLTPESSSIINGQVEGTLFQADDEGNPTGEVGMSGDCYNYVIYVSNGVETIGINKAADLRPIYGGPTSLYVNDEVWISQCPTQVAFMLKFMKNPVELKGNETKIELVWNKDNDSTFEIRYTFTVIKFKYTPEKLKEDISLLPSTEELEYELHYAKVVNMYNAYENMTDQEKGMLTESERTKLLEAYERVQEIKRSDDEALQTLMDLVDSYSGKITRDNYKDYVSVVNLSEDKYAALSRRCKEIFEGESQFKAMQEAVKLITNYTILDGENVGTPLDYSDDFMISSNAYNLTLGAPDDAYEISFREIWSARSEKGLPYTAPGMLTFEIKDPEIFEIREELSSYKDQGLGGGGTYENMKYYLIPKKEGTTTMSVTINSEKGDYLGQIPEIVVHVNSAQESEIEDLENKLTNIHSLMRTSKYDTWHYFDDQSGAEFRFRVYGEDPQISVYNYMEYDEDGQPVKTEYKADSNGNVSVLLKDGYNPIEVTATYNGKRVTQVYGLKGKVVKCTITNVTRPGNSFRVGDTVMIQLKGLATPVHKILRIYNPSATSYWYDTDMERQSVLKSQGGQYSAGAMTFELTSAGKVHLTNGRIYQIWFGSPLYSETAQGNTGGTAPQTGMEFSFLPDITLDVEENPDYNPESVQTVVEGGNTVRAGETIKIQVPDLNVNEISSSYPAEGSSRLLNAFLTYETDIPNCEIKSVEVDNVNDLERIKTINVKIPEDTVSGTYKIYGGHADIVYGETWWLKYTDMFEKRIADLELTVEGTTANASLPSEQEVRDMMDQIGSNQVSHVTDPSQGMLQGEWTVFGLARGGLVTDEYKETYLMNVTEILDKNKGRLDGDRATEYTHTVIMLSALGIDPKNVNGYDLLQPLADFDRVTEEGTSGALWALLALDTRNYDVPLLSSGDGANQTTREKIVQYILDNESSQGGWSTLSNGLTNVDLTAMVIQALAPYYSTDEPVREAVDRALETLSGLQDTDGDFGSPESNAQVIVALNRLGIPLDDARFVKRGHDVLDGLMKYYSDDGYFSRKSGEDRDQMATDQGLYALVSYYRVLSGENDLYQMDDVYTDDELAAKQVDDLILAIGNVTKDSKEAIDRARNAYDQLTDAQKKLVTKLEILENAQKAYMDLAKDETDETRETEETKETEKSKDSNGANADSPKDKTSGGGKQGNTTKTGDYTPILPVCILCVVSAGAMVLLTKKKFRRN